MEYITAPLIIGLITAVLAACISIVDRIVNNYGDVKIDINKGKKELTVKGGAPLLHLLSAEKYSFPLHAAEGEAAVHASAG